MNVNYTLISDKHQICSVHIIHIKSKFIDRSSIENKIIKTSIQIYGVIQFWHSKEKSKSSPILGKPKMLNRKLVQPHIFFVFRYIRKNFAAKQWLMIKEINQITFSLPIAIPDLSDLSRSVKLLPITYYLDLSPVTESLGLGGHTLSI
jgi:hypothetical protein